jgi:hypothetical protein
VSHRGFAKSRRSGIYFALHGLLRMNVVAYVLHRFQCVSRLRRKGESLCCALLEMWLLRRLQ